VKHGVFRRHYILLSSTIWVGLFSCSKQGAWVVEVEVSGSIPKEMETAEMLTGDSCLLDRCPMEEDAVFLLSPLTAMMPETRVVTMSILEVGDLGQFVQRTNWKPSISPTTMTSSVLVENNDARLRYQTEPGVY